MFSLNGTLKNSGLVGRWEPKQFIGMALLQIRQTNYPSGRIVHLTSNLRLSIN